MMELSLEKQLISILLASLFPVHDLMCARGFNPSSPPNIYLLFSSFYMLYFNHMCTCLHVQILEIGQICMRNNVLFISGVIWPQLISISTI